MKAVFADTGYWIALLRPNDPSHQRAITLANELKDNPIVTTDLIIVELLARFCAEGSFLRKAAVHTVRRVMTSAQIEIVPIKDGLFMKAFELYAKRHDKKWSLTDCASFEMMKRRHIKEALAYDHHFEQAGFTALLRQ